MLVQLKRSPEGADSVGVAVVEAPETAAPEKEAPETTEADTKPEAKAEKPKLTDWERYQKLQEKYEKNPHAKPTKAELEISKKYLGKEEHQIEGYKKAAKSTLEPEAEEAKEPAKAIAEADEPEEESDPLEPVYKAVGAKDKTQLKSKVEGLVSEVKKLSGMNGEVGRLLKEAGVQDVKGLSKVLQDAGRLHQLVQDLKADRPEALAFIGKQPKAAEKFTGTRPDNVLDDGLFDYIAPQLKAANDRAEKLERELAAFKAKLDPWERSQAETQATQARSHQLNSIITEVTTLADATEWLWDSKKSGSLAKALTEYYTTNGAHHPDLAPILDILKIAGERNFKEGQLEDALAIWERKNGGSLIAKARNEAREPFIGKAPNVGLSDRQGNHNGQFKTYTEATVKEMAAGRRAIPREWTDAQGTIDPKKVPANLRHLVTMED